MVVSMLVRIFFYSLLTMACYTASYAQVFTNYQPPKQELGEVTSLAIDRDGLKWIGTTTGLYAFTGDSLPTAWRLFDNPHTSDTLLRYVTAIAIDKHNHKWVASYHNGVSLIELDKHGNYVKKYDLPNFKNKDHYIRNIIVDAHDTKWLATKEGGVWTIDKHGKHVMYDITTVYEFPSNHVYAIGMDSEGTKWIGTDKGLTSTVNGEEWNYIYTMDFLILAITTDANKNVCICAEKRKSLMVYCNGELHKVKGKDEFTVVNDILLDNKSILWAAGNGLAKYEQKDRIIYDKNNSNFASRNATRLAVDKENMIWIGTADKGLYKLDPRPVKVVEPPIEPEVVRLPVGTLLVAKKVQTIPIVKVEKPKLRVVKPPPMVIPATLLNAKVEPYVEEPDTEPVIPIKPEPVKPEPVKVVVQPAVVTEADGTKVATIQGEKVRKGGAISLKGINFKTNSDEFINYQGVEQLLKFMLENTSVEIELAGHSDRDPFPNEDNAEEIKRQYLELSQRRVDAVVFYLKSAGIAANRMTTKAYGGSKPLVAAKYSEKNRRVELRITKIE